ncbi:hypothetical protein HDU91_001270 [Kappamyces sp. JEL0680]|nr:hypothetical protein HDU91_001270 [Kappamyces sp. JEL0680]
MYYYDPNQMYVAQPVYVPMPGYEDPYRRASHVSVSHMVPVDPSVFHPTIATRNSIDGRSIASSGVSHYSPAHNSALPLIRETSPVPAVQPVENDYPMTFDDPNMKSLERIAQKTAPRRGVSVISAISEHPSAEQLADKPSRLSTGEFDDSVRYGDYYTSERTMAKRQGPVVAEQPLPVLPEGLQAQIVEDPDSMSEVLSQEERPFPEAPSSGSEEHLKNASPGPTHTPSSGDVQLHQATESPPRSQ